MVFCFRGSIGEVVIDSRSSAIVENIDDRIVTTNENGEPLVSEQNKRNSEFALNNESSKPLFIETWQNVDPVAQVLKKSIETDLPQERVTSLEALLKPDENINEKEIWEEETVHYLVPDKTDTTGIIFSSFDFISVTTPKKKSILKDPSKANMSQQTKKSVHFDDDADDIEILKNAKRLSDMPQVSTSNTYEHLISFSSSRTENTRGKFNCKLPLKRRNSLQLTLALEDKIGQRRKSLTLPQLPKIKCYGSSTVSTALTASSVKRGAKVVFRGKFGDCLRRRCLGDDVSIADVLGKERYALGMMIEKKQNLTEALQKQFESPDIMAVGTSFNCPNKGETTNLDISPEESEALFHAYRSQSSGKRLSVQLNNTLQNKIRERRKSLTAPPIPPTRMKGSTSVENTVNTHQAKSGTKIVLKGPIGKQLRNQSIGDGDRNMRDILLSERDDIQIVSNRKDKVLHSLQKENNVMPKDSTVRGNGDAEFTHSEDELENDVFEESSLTSSCQSKVALLQKLLNKREELANRFEAVHQRNSSANSHNSEDVQSKQEHKFLESSQLMSNLNKGTGLSEENVQSLVELKEQSNEQESSREEPINELDHSMDSDRTESMGEVASSDVGSNNTGSEYNDKSDDSGFQDQQKTDGEKSMSDSSELKDLDAKSTVITGTNKENVSKTLPASTSKSKKKNKSKLSVLKVVMKCMSEWKTPATVHYLCHQEMSSSQKNPANPAEEGIKSTDTGENKLSVTKDKVTEETKLYDLRVGEFYQKKYYPKRNDKSDVQQVNLT